MSPAGKKPEETGKRPEPDGLDLKWSYIPISGDPEYFFEVYKGDGSDMVYFVDQRNDPQPWELQDGPDDLGLTRQHMTELRDTLTYLLDNWGMPWARESHPDEEEE